MRGETLCYNTGTNVRGDNAITLESELASASVLAAWTQTLTLAITFKPLEIEHLYFICVERAFIFHMCIPCDKTFHMVP